MVISIINDGSATFNVDFVISMLFFLLVVGTVISISEGRVITAQETAEAAEARLLSEEIAQAIDVSYSGGEGHEIGIEMPDNLKGSDYNVKINHSGVLVIVGGRRGYSFSGTKKISNYAMTESEVTLLPKRAYIFRNVKDSNNCHMVVIF